MRITMVIIGTWGDVQSHIALGLGFQAAGHTVRVATHRNFADLVISSGLAFAPVADAREAVEAAGGHQAIGDKRYSPRFLRHLTRLLAPCLEQAVVDCWDACEEADVIIASGLGIMPGYHVAEKRRLPLVRAVSYPLSPSRAYPAYFVPASLHTGAALNLCSHYFRDQVMWLLLRASQNQGRRDLLNLHPLPLRDPFGRLERNGGLLLYGYSPLLFPRPADWGPTIHVTGYWFLDRPSNWQPAAELVDFLESGPPPVYVGFGSMGNRSPQGVTDLVIKALAQTGQRGVLLSGMRGLAGQAGSDDIYFVDDVPHDWLFPRMAAVVHHGGSGTTHAGLRAGMPSVLVPYIPDQYFWAQRVTALGVGPPPLPRRTLSSETLAEAIRVATTDTGMRDRAVSLSRQIQGEDGVACAVAAFHAHLAAAPSP